MYMYLVKMLIVDIKYYIKYYNKFRILIMYFKYQYTVIYFSIQSKVCNSK